MEVHKMTPPADTSPTGKLGNMRTMWWGNSTPHHRRLHRSTAGARRLRRRQPEARDHSPRREAEGSSRSGRERPYQGQGGHCHGYPGCRDNHALSRHPRAEPSAPGRDSRPSTRDSGRNHHGSTSQPNPCPGAGDASPHLYRRADQSNVPSRTNGPQRCRVKSPT